jgi:hypothetical protein
MSINLSFRQYTVLATIITSIQISAHINKTTFNRGDIYFSGLVQID